MALTGNYFDTHPLKGNTDAIFTQQIDYTPIGGISAKDSTEQFATTSFVANYRQPVIDLGSKNGSISFSVNNNYRVRLNGTSTINLPTPQNQTIKNEIKIYLELGATDTNIAFSSNIYWLYDKPYRFGGSYILLCEWNPLVSKWGIGSYFAGGIK